MAGNHDGVVQESEEEEVLTDRAHRPAERAMASITPLGSASKSDVRGFLERLVPVPGRTPRACRQGGASLIPSPIIHPVALRLQVLDQLNFILWKGTPRETRGFRTAGPQIGSWPANPRR
jgi:hypothetical protein